MFETIWNQPFKIQTSSPAYVVLKKNSYKMVLANRHFKIWIFGFRQTIRKQKHPESLFNCSELARFWFSSPHWTLKQPKSSLASFYYNWQPHTQPSIVDWSGIPNNMSSCVTPLKSKVVLMVGWVVLFRKVTIQKTKVYVHINFTWGVRGVFYEFF